MNVRSSARSEPHGTSWAVIGISIVALAVAMGIGRFAFTPLLPLMLRDGTLSVATGAEWAAANYAGYLVGALTAPWFSANPRRGLHMALLGVAVTTLAVALVGDATLSLFGALLRGAAGIFSAWVLVCTSSWGLAELARREALQLGSWIYTGVGVGITFAGLLVWLGGFQPARWLWLELGVLAALGAMFVKIRSMAVDSDPTISHRSFATAPVCSSGQTQLGLVLCYGTFGFGYIVPATFLPAMARQQVSDPLVFGLAWPLFGLAAALSVVGAARWLSLWPRRRVWALAQAVMALGTALLMFTHALWALAASAVFVGGTFMVATMAGLQLAREQAPSNPTKLIARMTAAFALGQIMGPLLVRALGSGTWAGWDALSWANAVATALLVLSAAWLWLDVDRKSSPFSQEVQK